MEGSDAFPGSTGYSGILSKYVLQNILTFGALGAKGPVMDKEQRVLSHTAQWEDRALAATSPWLGDPRGRESWDSTQFPLPQESISISVIGTCALFLRGKEMETLFSVFWGRSGEELGAEFGLNHF